MHGLEYLASRSAPRLSFLSCGLMALAVATSRCSMVRGAASAKVSSWAFFWAAAFLSRAAA